MNGSNLSAMDSAGRDLPITTGYEVKLSVFPSQEPAGSSVSPTPGLTREARELLHCRVLLRTREIEHALLDMHAGPQEVPSNTAREIALRTALDIVHDTTRGGWEQLGERGTLKLTRWLHTTGPLVARPPEKLPTPLQGTPVVAVSPAISGTAVTLPEVGKPGLSGGSAVERAATEPDLSASAPREASGSLETSRLPS